MPYIAYYRVSTQRQGASGLGLDAQRVTVGDFLRSEAPIDEYTEVESGRKTDRPQLAAAIEACHLYGATLLVAKLDRLARNAFFLHQLQHAGVKFACCDMPDANDLTIHILAAVAEDEAKRISARTKAALAAAKRRGVKLGTPANLRNGGAGRERSLAVRAARARERAQRLAPVLTALQGQGMGLHAMARELDRRRIPAARGGRWSAAQVKRVVISVAL